MDIKSNLSDSGNSKIKNELAHQNKIKIAKNPILCVYIYIYKCYIYINNFGKKKSKTAKILQGNI